MPQLLDTAYDIWAVPAACGLTTPPDTVATVVASLLHVPPVTDGVRVDVEPMHIAVLPDNAPAVGKGFTVIVCIA